MNATDILRVEASGRKTVMIASLALSQSFAANASNECRNYFSALCDAVELEPPPFDTAHYADLYRQASSNAQWLAISLITNAEREGDGATRLWSLASCSPSQEERQLLKAHAIDESRHAFFYLTLLDRVFPSMTDAQFRRELRKLSPGYSSRMEPFPVPGSPYAKPPTIDDYIQMNIAEIRTAIHHLLQRAALAFHAPSSNEKIEPVLNALLRDELKHVGYTARLIERIVRRTPDIELLPLLRKRLRDFNQITKEELGYRSFDCSVACCESRPHCRARAGSSSGFIDRPI